MESQESPVPGLAKPAPPEPSGRTGLLSRPLVAPLLIALLCFAAYLSNGRTLPHAMAGDTIPTRLVPFSLLGYGTLTLDPFRNAVETHGGRIWIRETGGHLVSSSPIGTPMVAVPFYAIAWGWFILHDWTEASTILVLAEKVEKPVAAAIAALAVAFVYGALRRRVSLRSALVTALGFGLATSMWGTASQMLWQQGPVAFSVSLGLLFLTWPSSPRWSIAAGGAAFGLAFACRPTSAIFLAAAGLAVLVGGRSLADGVRRSALFALSALPVIGLALLYNLVYYGNLLGWYGQAKGIFELARLPIGFAGLLVSPNRGILVFSPVVALGFAGFVRSWLSPRRDPLVACLGAGAIAHIVLVATYRDWGAAFSFGTRYLTDILPILALAGGEIVERLTRAPRRIFALLLAWSLLVQLNGVVCYPASNWNGRFRLDIEKAAWDWTNFELWQDFQSWREQPKLVAPWQ
jgi:hypothetical protein